MSVRNIQRTKIQPKTYSNMGRKAEQTFLQRGSSSRQDQKGSSVSLPPREMPTEITLRDRHTPGRMTGVKSGRWWRVGTLAPLCTMDGMSCGPGGSKGAESSGPALASGGRGWAVWASSEAQPLVRGREDVLLCGFPCAPLLKGLGGLGGREPRGSAWRGSLSMQVCLR